MELALYHNLYTIVGVRTVRFILFPKEFLRNWKQDTRQNLNSVRRLHFSVDNHYATSTIDARLRMNESITSTCLASFLVIWSYWDLLKRGLPLLYNLTSDLNLVVTSCFRTLCIRCIGSYFNSSKITLPELTVKPWICFKCSRINPNALAKVCHRFLSNRF